MAIDHQFYPFISKEFFNPFAPLSGIATYMRKKYLDTLDLENIHFRAFPPHRPGVDISTHGPYRAYFREPVDYCRVSHVAGVPNLIAAGEMSGKPLIPQSMRIADNTNPFHHFF